jgi:ankyrin repeat protein
MRRKLFVLVAAIVLTGVAACSKGSEKAESPRNPQEHALRVHAYKGEVEPIKELLAQGVNVNARDEQGGTALMLAAMANKVEVVKLLLEHGADVNAQSDGGNTALIAAAGKGNLEILQLLVDAGADPLIKNESGMTAAVNAAFSSQPESVIFLKKAEAAKDKG